MRLMAKTGQRAINFSAKMLININGKPEEAKIQSNLSDLVLSKGLCVEKVVIEHNLRIVPREEWPETFLGENDNIEIISFVGGG